MALAQETDLLLLDEPTTYLDLTHQVEVLDLLVDLNKSEERTIVMVLHDLNLACRYGDHLIAMKDGAIVAEGTPRGDHRGGRRRCLRPRCRDHPRPGRRDARWSSRSAATSPAPTPSRCSAVGRDSISHCGRPRRLRRRQRHLPPHRPLSPIPRSGHPGLESWIAALCQRAVRPPEFTTRCPRGGRGPASGGGGPAPLSNHPRSPRPRSATRGGRSSPGGWRVAAVRRSGRRAVERRRSCGSRSDRGRPAAAR